MSSCIENILSSLVSHAATTLPYIVDGITVHGLPARGHAGTKLFADNARILFVNEVGSEEHECRKKAAQISEIFDRCRVDYVYIPLTYLQAHHAIKNHREPDGSSLFLETIHDFDDELRHGRRSPMTQPAHRILDGGERIICIVHSGGGASLESIRDKIPLDSRGRMDVISFGSAQLFHTGEFRNVRNFVAENDVIPAISSVIAKNALGLLDPSTHIVPTMQGEDPVASHQFASKTYQSVLARLRNDYDSERSRR